MFHFDTHVIESLFSYKEFIPVLRDYFTKDIKSPPRPHFSIENNSSAPNTLLLMPAWQIDTYIGIKIITVFKENAKIGLNTINGTYFLLDGKTGQALSTFDASTITSKRTAATSALAASFLARPESRSYTVLGTGQLCRELVHAYNSIFELEQINIWGRDSVKATAKVEELNLAGFHAKVVEDKINTLSDSDIISAATYSKTPIVHGKYINSGTHIDLIGSYLPDHREGDDELVIKSSLFIDTKTALKESGDLVIPIKDGLIKASDIQGTLIELCKEEDPGRLDKNEITFFKSVGYALEDLAIAIYLYQKHQHGNIS